MITLSRGRRRSKYTERAYGCGCGASPAPIRASGARSRSRSRSRVRIHLSKPGALTKYGYHVDLQTKQRDAALNKAVRHEDASKIFKRLNVLAIYNKYNHPGLSNKYLRDRNYIRRNFM